MDNALLLTHRTSSIFNAKTAKQFVATLICIFSLTSASHAEDDGSSQKSVQYVDLKPAFVANFGNSSKKLKFVKADVSVRVNSDNAASAVEQHMPLIRNEIVLLLSAQSEESIGSVVGQEKVRQEALTQIKKVMEEETGSATIEYLLFTNFVLQR